MIRVKFFFDGFNLYHAIMKQGLGQYRWLDLPQVAENLINPKRECISGIQYFSARQYWRPDKVARHRVYTDALEAVGVEVTLGRYQEVTKKCRAKCQLEYIAHEEKRTDCNIVAAVLGSAYNNAFDTAIIVSADSDMLAAVDAIRNNFPKIRLGFAFPPGLKSYHLRQQADFVKKVRVRHLKNSLLPDSITVHNGKSLTCPASWKE